MSGPGKTRIDAFLCNALANALIVNAELRWDLGMKYDHACLALRLSVQAMFQQVQRLAPVMPISLDNFYFDPPQKATPAEREVCRQWADEDFARHWRRFEDAFAAALANQDIDKAHEVWCSAAEIWLALNQEHGESEFKCLASSEVHRRGSAIPLVQQSLAQNVRVSKDAKLMGFDADRRQMLSRLLEIKCILELAMQRNGQIDVPWRNCCCNVQQIVSLTNIITKMNDDGSVSHLLEDAFTGKQLLKWCQESIICLQDEAGKAAKSKLNDERRIKKLELSDPKSGFKNFMAHLKKTPGSAISVISKADGSLTSQRNEILDEFAATWEKIYNRLKASPPSFADFDLQFGQFIPNEPTGDLCPTPDHLYAKASSARDAAAPGMDGWRPSELKKLPRQAWVQRHRLLLLVKLRGTWPTNYLRVAAPSLRKADRLDPDALRSPPSAKDVRLLSIYTQLYRVEAGAWFGNHVEWLVRNVHSGCVGGLKGLESLMASWDAQSNMAEAHASQDPFAMAFLDYFKFFDSFQPAFFGHFLLKAGMHADFVRLFVHLNENSKRFVKIADTYSNPITPFNALGQGDPWVLIVALLYVSTQFRMINHFAPLIKCSAVIDDRSLQGPPRQLHCALLKVFVFDSLAGHITHPDKLTVSACSKRDRSIISEWVFDGIKPKLVQYQRLVGDTVTNLCNGASQLANSRLEFSIRTAARIKAAESSARSKLWAMQAMAIPRMVPSTLWTKPLDGRLRVLRTSIIGSVLSKSRNLRCPEVVMSVCMNPARADPRSVLLYRSLLDARRVLSKTPARLEAFIQDLRSMVKRKLELSQLCIGPVKGVLEVVIQLFESSPIQGGDLRLIPQVGPSCLLIGSSMAEFKRFITQTLRQAIWTDLENLMDSSNPRRKDMTGFSKHINLQASMLGSVPPKHKANFIPAKLWKQLHLTVVTGATVAGDRMLAMKSVHSDICPLDQCRHTTEHLFWECSAFEALRRPFTKRIGQIIGVAVHKGTSVQLYITGVLADTSFRCLGIVPGDPLAPDYAKKQRANFVLKPPVTADMLLSKQTCYLKLHGLAQSFVLRSRMAQ